MKSSEPIQGSVPAAPADDSSAGFDIGPPGLRQWSGWLLGPGALLLTLVTAPPSGLSVEGWRTAGAGLLMAIWWLTEPIPIPATSLLPLALFPLLGLGDIDDAAAPYANPVVFLFLGGFVLALAMERWQLHRRLAIGLIGIMGLRPSSIVAGLLIASAFLSMWVSNTATTLMMLPIAMSVATLLGTDNGPQSRQRDFQTAVVLAVAYGATSGGMGTLIGTPPNALLAGYVSTTYGITVGFGQWMLIGVPIVILSVAAVHVVLTRVMFSFDRDEVPGAAELIAAERSRLGPISRPELTVAIVFVLTACAWIFRPLIAKAFPMVSDTTIAVMGALVLFMIPVDWRRGTFIMNWQGTRRLPWAVLLLFGGGLSLAHNIDAHGLSTYLGGLAGGLSSFPTLLILCATCFGILMLTELTSNTATAATFLPIMGALALNLGENPLLFLIPTALAANCSYMMPVGTPPNAIAYGSGLVTLPQMARAGVILNVVLVPVLIGALLLLGPAVFDVRIGVFPSWAR